MSRTVAAAVDSEREAFRAALRAHLLIAVVATAILVIAAPIVTHLQGAPEILTPLIAIAGVLFMYGVYAPLIGYINGRRMFTRQATLNIVAATLRTAGLIGVGWLFVRVGGGIARATGTLPGLLGATVGAVVASIGVFAFALRWTGTGRGFSVRPSNVPTFSSYLKLIIPVMIAQLFVNGLMQADIFLLGRYLSLSAAFAAAPLNPGGVVRDASTAANEWVAVYRACQLFAFLPYQLLFSVTQVLFPMLARAKKEEGDARVAELVARGSRIGAIMCGMLVVVIVAMPQSMIRLAYDADIARTGAPALRVLVLGQAAFAMLGLSTTILVSLGRERAAMTLTAVALTLLTTSCVLIIPSREFGGDQLVGASTATAAALGVSLIFGVVTVHRTAHAFVPWKTALRVGACIAAAAVAGRYVPPIGKLLTLIVAPMIGLAYLAFLVVTGELGKSDLNLVLTIVRPKKK